MGGGAGVSMDEAKLGEIEARAKAATPGPWVLEKGDRYRPEYPMDLRIRCEWSPPVNGACGHELFRPSGVSRSTEPDASFVCHAREDVPALVDEVRRLREANESLVAAFDAALARSHDRITVSGHRAIVPQIDRQH